MQASLSCQVENVPGCIVQISEYKFDFYEVILTGPI